MNWPLQIGAKKANNNNSLIRSMTIKIILKFYDHYIWQNYLSFEAVKSLAKQNEHFKIL